MKMHSVFEVLLLSLASGAALAGVADLQVPEPGILELLAVSAVAAVVVAIRKRRK